MIFFGIRTALGMTASLALAGVAQADVTAQDVWGDWQAYMAGVGYEMTSEESRSGDTLSVENIQMTAPDLGDDSSMVMRLSGLEFRENGDGSVNVIYPETLAINLLLSDPSGTDFDIDLEVRAGDMDMVVTGVPTDMKNTYAADTLEMVLTDVTMDDEDIDLDDVAGRLVMSDLSGTTQSIVGGKRVYDQKMRAAKTSYEIKFADPEGTGTFAFNSDIDDLTFSGSSALPLAVVQASDMSALLNAGMTADGRFGYSRGSSNMRIEEDGTEALLAETSSSGGTLGVEMTADGLAYSGTQDDFKISASGSELPLPMDFNMVSAAFNLAMPVQKSDDPQDFALGFSFNDFSMSETLWSMFDPSQQLPRDPATLVLDLAGKARLLFDFLDPSAATVAASPGFTPGELDALDINRLQISLAGAELTGEGAFTFDNSAPVGPPQPIGAADLKLVGGNTLLDRLVEMGLLPQDQAMGARMMMGLLAVPGDAPDTLTSKIEVNDQGHVLANGQRIQ
ncbi:hypothetical protein So717_09500 [Roseobacter cerasinus]|uniref:DUF2125 domain-containing protein n=1 Tax=Roseobacter cerasinus TaxID=2602289 RepID=A0A640VN79_9RHOB|nr:DUF2125 domain-containing protein [Roseobacter cerasinus]GFE49197.1 hypothetical protein So717_09500 [Roseobacter cerasinus]